MFYIKNEEQGDNCTHSELLTNFEIQLNNLKIKLSENGDLSIQTGGEWKGHMNEFTHAMHHLINDFIDAKKNKQ